MPRHETVSGDLGKDGGWCKYDFMRQSRGTWARVEAAVIMIRRIYMMYLPKAINGKIPKARNASAHMKEKLTTNHSQPTLASEIVIVRMGSPENEWIIAASFASGEVTYPTDLASYQAIF